MIVKILEITSMKSWEGIKIRMSLLLKQIVGLRCEMISNEIMVGKN